MSRRLVPGWPGCLMALVLVTWTSWAAPVLIGEFMASNSRGLADEDNDFPDWIELRNVSDNAVNLNGWFLTDDAANLRRWRIPGTNLVARGYLVIFASGKDRREPGQPLHTNFRLGASGEYLALVEPDGVTVATEFSPNYPGQFEDISYGVAARVATTPLVTPGTGARFLVPSDGSLEATWRDVSFNDADWESGETGLGFASNASRSGGGLHDYWPVEEGTGGQTVNRVAGGANGTLHGVAWENDPVRGTVLSFNGRDSYVSAGTLPRMGVSSNFTWSFWFKQRSVRNVNSVILGNRSGGAPGGLQFIKFTPSTFEYYHDGNIGFMTHNVPGGSWRHLAVVKQAGLLVYYDNGSAVGNARVGGDIGINPLYWGGDPGAPGEYVDGLIDDVSLWSQALTPDQIRELQQGVSPWRLSGVGGLVKTDIGGQMQGINSSVYLRIPFSVPEEARGLRLKLRVRYNDGFVAYLNGVEIARRNSPVGFTWNSAATGEHPATAGSEPETFDVPVGLVALMPGVHVLAIQGLNRDVGDSDFLILPELDAVAETALGWRYFEQPTPGGINGTGSIGFMADVEFDRPRGFYDEPFNVVLTCATPGGTIRYTTDGTEPTSDHGSIYRAPVRINGTTVLRAGAFQEGYATRQTGARSYLFLDQILAQTGAGLPQNWGNDWQMDSRVVSSPAYAGRIRDDMKSLPVVSLALDPLDFWGGSGIYTLSTGRGDEYERPCSVEMFFPDGSEPGFQVGCGVQIVGGASRTMTPKHGLGLTFKSRYGSSKLNYRFFPNSEVEKFDFIAFRPIFNMSWVRTDNSGPLNNANADGAERLHAIYVRDQFTKESQLAMGQVSAHERFVHLYINGVYWGLYNPGERTDSTFAAAYLGGDKEDYDTIFSDGSTVARAHDGDKNAWREMMQIAGRGLATPDAYDQIQQYLDVTNLADYMMLNFYCATVDWPWQNWNAARRRENGSQFQFFIWDADYTLETPPWVPDDRTGVGGASGEADSPARLYHELRKNPEWRLLFADRVRKHFFNQGALTTNQAIPRFLALCDTIDGAIVCESARWGDVVRRNQPYTRDVEWLAEKNRLLTRFFPQRTDRVIQQFIQAGLYPDLPAPVMSRSDGVFREPFSLALSASSGFVYYTTDGLDPRLPGGKMSPSARLYSAPIAVSGNSRILARTWRNNTWSALSEAVFSIQEQQPTLKADVQGSTIVISWPEGAEGFILETGQSLRAPQWLPVGQTPGNRATIRPGLGTRFYRLRKP
ncbi:MAG: chitobiase/beta-hexosaminidase C-terminal domain-containing protein [Verrucomicrobia bacterium]|nr:chitobiase/beta-hexosaminidase C-terminal domain-containing protein [Verrucomicrobiota bacterium]